MSILIIKTGSTVPDVLARRGDFEAWFASGLGVTADELSVCEVFRDEVLPNAETFAAVVVTGSASMVTDNADWSLAAERWLARAVEYGPPILAVCYGHQLLARALGGQVDNNPAGRQVGTVDVTLTEAGARDALLGQMKPVFHAPVSHLQVVHTLPPGATRLATTTTDGNHAFAVGERAWGVQFHPEFDADIVRGYIDARRERIDQEGGDASAARAATRDTDDGKTLLRAFAALAASFSPPPRR